MSDDMSRTMLNIRIPNYLRRFLKEEAHRRGTSMTDVLLSYLHGEWEKQNFDPVFAKQLEEIRLPKGKTP